MTLAAYRARKRLMEYRDTVPPGLHTSGILVAIDILDQELERVAEQEFLRPMNPDPLKAISDEMRQKKV